MTYLSLKNVSKQYEQGVGAFDIDLEVERGEAVCLLGASGCGKTTLLRIIAGLIVPDSGRLLIDGEDVTAAPAHARDIGMVFQTWALFPHLTVARNVEFGLAMRGISKAARRRRSDEMLELVGLSALRDRRPSQLSGGQQQRVALARALAINPRVLLLDEPMSSLDFNTRVELRRQLRQLQREIGVTAVYVTHDYSEALAVADKTILMKAGRMVETGPTKALFERPSTAFGARFLGLHNLVPGEMLSRSADTVEVRLADGSNGTVSRSKSGNSDRISAPGSKVLVGFDEWSTIFVPDDRSQAASAGQVTGITTEHGYTRLEVRLGDTEIVLGIRMPGYINLPMGLAGRIEFDWAKAWLVDNN